MAAEPVNEKSTRMLEVWWLDQLGWSGAMKAAMAGQTAGLNPRQIAKRFVGFELQMPASDQVRLCAQHLTAEPNFT
jgi:hypothetical protein